MVHKAHARTVSDYFLGWNAPRKSLLLVHPDGEGSRVGNGDLNIAFEPPPDYAGIAKAAACHKAFIGRAMSTEELHSLLGRAVEEVQSGKSAILDVHIPSTGRF